MTTAPPRPPSMLRSYAPADALTIANASCGTIAVFLCLDYMAFGDTRRLWIAILLLPLALLCDVLDGYVARLHPATALRPRRRPRLARRRDLVRPGTGGARLYARAARRLGHGLPDLLRGLRRQPPGAVQRHRSGADQRRDRQGPLLRRHADSDQHPDRGASGRRLVERPGGAGRVVRRPIASGRWRSIHWRSSTRPAAAR